ncbi:MAG: hypothetical protein MJ187_04655 [Alphaproteobacteria bacterium]|nr:hypothetical protein [Alphaproteobacteria bacterium]
MKKTFEKTLNVLTRNMGYTIVLIIAIVLFAIFSGGLLNGIITALSAIIGATCVTVLIREYKKTPDPVVKPAPVAKPVATKAAPAKKASAKKAPAKKAPAAKPVATKAATAKKAPAKKKSK